MVITGLTRNQFACKRTWVRIPPSPPSETRLNSQGSDEFSFISSRLSAVFGAIRKRFSENAPIRSALSVSFYRVDLVFGGCLTAERSDALVYVKHPP